MQAFDVYVRPLLEFSSQVWSPHHKYLIDKVESVQRFLLNVSQDFEGYLIVRARLNILGSQTLESRRLINDLTLCYKTLYGLCDTSLSINFNLSNSVTRGSCLKLVKPNCSSDIRKYFFTSRVNIDVWNCLNDDIVKSRSISVFKKRLSGVKFDRFLTVGLTD